MGAHKLRVHAHYGRISGQKNCTPGVQAVFLGYFRVGISDSSSGERQGILPLPSSSGCPFPRHSPSRPLLKRLSLSLAPWCPDMYFRTCYSRGANSLPLRHATASVCTYIRPLVACSCFFISATRGDTRDVCKMKKGMHESLGDVWLIPPHPLPGK